MSNKVSNEDSHVDGPQSTGARQRGASSASPAADHSWRERVTQLLMNFLDRLRWVLSLSLARTGLIIAAVFFFDLLTPLGISGGVLYMAAVLSAVPIRHRLAIFITGGICGVLVLVGWVISPGRGETELWKILLNRSLALGVIAAAVAMTESWRRLQDRRGKQMQESRLLHQATALAAFEGSFQEALQNSVRVLCDIFAWPAAHIYLKDGEGEHLVSADTWHLPPDGRFELLRTTTTGVRFAPGEGAAGRIWQTAQPIAVADVSQSPHYQWLKEPSRLGVKGAFAFPLIVSGEVAAVVEFFSDREIQVNPEFSSLAENVGQQLGRLFERRRADQALRRSEERLRLALRASQMGTFEWQIETGRLLWSPELEQMHGLAPNSFAGTFDAFAETVHPDDRQRLEKNIQETLRTHKEFHCEYRMLGSDGQVQWFDGRGAVQLGVDGQPRRMVGVCMDITQRKQVEFETQRARDVAESANRLRGQFLANVSHELRTPMNAVLGMLQLSLADHGLPAEMRENLETAKRSADSLLVLLNDVLDFSRIEAQGLQLQVAPFVLRATLDDTIRSLAARAFEKQLELVCDVAADVPDQLEGDADRLRQIVTNLVTNAIKFTDQGEVVVRVEVEQQLPQEVRLRFSVRDTGIGISARDQKRVFHPFTQADASATRAHGGVGLGLAISSELTQLMGGQLRLESAPGEGSCFFFSLTFATDQDSGQAHSPTLPYEQLASLSVLVVDDNETNRGVIVESLRRWSMQPEAAIDADHALGKLHRADAEDRHFSLMIIDARMPGMDGFELAKATLADFDHAPPIIMMLSAPEPNGKESEIDDLPIAARLEKPISPSRLLDAVMTTLHVEPPHDLPERDSPSPTAQRPLDLLVVEDTPANQKIVRTILERRGHRVLVADHGAEALEILKSGRSFDVILMDVQMPVMDGYEATDAIRALQGDVRRTPIVAMTAHAMGGDREKCLAAGMDTYLAKPLDVERLVEVVEGIAGDAGLPSDAGTTVANPSLLNHDSIRGRASLPALDYEATMNRLGNDEQLFGDIVRVFDEDAPRLIEVIHRAVLDGDFSQLESAAHSLKGLSANVGGRFVSQVAGELELAAAQGCADGNVSRVESLGRQLQQELARLMPELDDFRSPSRS